jgi:Holliday junction resolvase RusA-like endonuclease
MAPDVDASTFPLRITVLGTPVGKGRPRFVRKTGHAYTPEATRNYETVLRLAAQDEMKGRPPLEQPLHVRVTARFPVPQSWSKKKQEMALDGRLLPAKKPDPDNLLKAVDALNEVVWRDDAQIVRAEIIKTFSAIPALIVEVRAA